MKRITGQNKDKVQRSKSLLCRTTMHNNACSALERLSNNVRTLHCTAGLVYDCKCEVWENATSNRVGARES